MMININSNLLNKKELSPTLVKASQNPESSDPNQSRVIVVTSGKGGVGKTTTAAS